MNSLSAKHDAEFAAVRGKRLSWQSLQSNSSSVPTIRQPGAGRCARPMPIPRLEKNDSISIPWLTLMVWIGEVDAATEVDNRRGSAAVEERASFDAASPGRCKPGHRNVAHHPCGSCWRRSVVNISRTLAAAPQAALCGAICLIRHAIVVRPSCGTPVALKVHRRNTDRLHVSIAGDSSSRSGGSFTLTTSRTAPQPG